ncbi:MAG: T9SS type A sorting domain-containing protein [Ignavibacteria bacterium]|nr:T9SS type A sorting domain-containing protein [Ignavibacteria bacterium]
MVTALTRDHIAGQQLIPAVNGVSVAREWRNRNLTTGVVDQPGDPYGSRASTDPSESVAMEYQPWLIFNTGTSRFDLRHDDLTGGVFGFRFHDGGQVTHDQADNIYRVRYDHEVGANSRVVLQDVQPNDQIRMWSPKDVNMVRDYYENQNTRVMHVAVTLRRTEDDPLGGNPDDVVLSIRLPYGTGTNQPGANFIVFSRVPEVVPLLWVNHLDMNGNLRARTPQTLINAVNGALGTTEFNITKRMLPPMNDQNREVTLIAEFLCDREGVSGTALDVHNPFFRPHFGRVPDTRIGTLDVEVTHFPARLGVEIRNIRVQSPDATDLFFGLRDAAIRDCANGYLEDLLTINNDPALIWPGGGPPNVRVWQFYGRDEAMPMHWKSFRYINALLGGRLITEMGMEHVDEMQHCLQQHVLWQGASVTTNPMIATYFYQQGYQTEMMALPPLPPQPTDAELVARALEVTNLQRNHANIRFGMRDLVFPDLAVPHPIIRDDPDTYLDWRTRHNALPFEQSEDSIAYYINAFPGGILANLEFTLRNLYAAQQDFLFGPLPWLGQVWLNYHMQVQGHGDHFANFDNNRPRSYTEARQALWLPIMMGAKGIMLYKGTTGRESGPDPFPLLPADFHRDNNNPNGPPGADNLEGGLMGYRIPLNPLNWSANIFIRRLDFLADWAGGDFLEANDPTLVGNYFRGGFNAVRDRITASTTGGIWTGSRSLRNVTLEVTDRIQQMRFQLGRDVNGRTNAQPHILTELRLEGWYGKGFTEINVSRSGGENNPLIRFIKLHNLSQRFRSRHPERKRDYFPNLNVPGHFDYEVYDSSFFDITIHSLPNDRQMNNSAVISVFNRRTDPRMQAPGVVFNNENLPNWEFVSYPQWEARGAQGRYAQRGTREFTIPFGYYDATRPDPFQYRLLRIREMGGGIDTIIGQDKELAVVLLPGEAKFFQVDVVENEVHEDNRGWLAHNTQRKSVVFPVVERDENGTILYDPPVTELYPYCATENFIGEFRDIRRVRYGSGYRYHVVYHRRDINTLTNVDEGGNLSVYYRRSQLLTEDQANGANADINGIHNPLITWEDEIVLSRQVVINGVVSQLSCGYPSIVVRHDESLLSPLVYVVYACEGNQPTEILICESQLLAEATDIEQRAAYNQDHSIVIGYTNSNALCPPGDRLEFWGTPVVNASNNGNYYAWSDANVGIVTGFKEPRARRFDELNGQGNPAGGLHAVKFSNTPLMQAQYPTMHSYSKLHLGENECSIAWQEGPVDLCSHGYDIYYSRLRWNGVALAHELSPLAANIVWSGNPMPFNVPEPRIVCVSCNELPHGNGAKNEKPTLYRNLSEFDDFLMTDSNPLNDAGYANHKADRLVWEHIGPTGTYPGQPATIRMGLLARKSIDVKDRCYVLPKSTEVWASATSIIYDEQFSLHNPELIQGEQKTTVFSDQNDPNDHDAQSWKFGDTSLILSFNSEAAQGLNPQVYHMTFFDGLFTGADVEMNIDYYGRSDVATNVTFGDGAGGSVLGGRNPHVSARHSIVHSQSLLKNRRIFESFSPAEIRPNYVRSPWIARTAQGFFKQQADDPSSEERVFTGFRSNTLEALVSDLRVGGQRYDFELVDAQKKARSSPQRTVATKWFTMKDISDLELRSIAEGTAATKTSAWIERKVDGMRLELPIFYVRGTVKGVQRERAGKYAWSIIADEGEQYRVVIESREASSGLAQDVELHPTPNDRTIFKEGSVGDLEKNNNGILDLRKMNGLNTSLNTSSQRVECFPVPAQTEATLLLSGLPTDQQAVSVVITDVSGRTVHATSVKSRGQKAVLLSVDVSGYSPGLYTVSVPGSLLVGSFVVSR